MARRRFFVPEIRRGAAELTGPDAEHLVRVLRAEPGQVFELSDNRRVYLAEIETARKSIVTFRVLEELPAPEPAVQLSLLSALFKFDRFESLIEKATELGAGKISFFEGTRTEQGLAQAAPKRLARWQKIALEASQQARRSRLPQLDGPVPIAQILATNADVRLLLDESPDAAPLLRTLPAERNAGDHVALLVGPEGGWTADERAKAVAAGWVPCSLAQTVLRAETAAAAGLAVIQAAWLQTGRRQPARETNAACTGREPTGISVNNEAGSRGK